VKTVVACGVAKQETRRFSVPHAALKYCLSLFELMTEAANKKGEAEFAANIYCETAALACERLSAAVQPDFTGEHDAYYVGNHHKKSNEDKRHSCKELFIAGNGAKV
jgi:hypothetical protein